MLRRSVQGRVHIWDSGNIIADIGTETVYYIRVLTLIYAKKGETKTYYRFNGHGDVIALANSSGAIIKRYKYDAFGVEENPGIFDTNVFRYCGEYYDVETKTIYLRARYYDAETGRFTQQDGWSYAVPGFLLSLNLYTYCGSNPISYADPSGNCFKKIFGGVKNFFQRTANNIVDFCKNSYNNIKDWVNGIKENWNKKVVMKEQNMSLSKLEHFGLEKLKLSAALYLISLDLTSKYKSNEAPHLDFTNTPIGNAFEEAIIASDEFIDYRNRYESYLSGNDTMPSDTSLTFNSDTDLALSIHEIHMSVDSYLVGEEDGYSIYDVNFCFSDYYDFSKMDTDSLTTIINNLGGFYPQKFGLLTNYYLDFSFTIQMRIER